MKQERKRDGDAVIVIELNKLTYETLESAQNESELSEKFIYSKDIGLAEDNGKKWSVTVTRFLDGLYQATLIYDVVILWRGRKTHQDEDYALPMKRALDIVADRASHMLSTLTNDSFMRPLITPPFFDNEEPGK